VQHRFILINFLLFSAAVQSVRGAIQIPHCDCDCESEGSRVLLMVVTDCDH